MDDRDVVRCDDPEAEHVRPRTDDEQKCWDDFQLWLFEEHQPQKAIGQARLWGNLLLIAILLAVLAPVFITMVFFSGGCVEKAFWVDAATQIPAGVVEMTVEPGALQVNASAPAVEIPEKMVNIEVQPGAVQLQVDAPVQQDFDFGRSWVWIAAGIGAVLLACSKPIWKWFF